MLILTDMAMAFDRCQRECAVQLSAWLISRRALMHERARYQSVPTAPSVHVMGCSYMTPLTCIHGFCY